MCDITQISITLPIIPPASYNTKKKLNVIRIKQKQRSNRFDTKLLDIQVRHMNHNRRNSKAHFTKIHY